MPIILPGSYEPDERAYEICLVASMIESAMTGDRPIYLHELAERILDEVDEIRCSNAAEAEWMAALPEEPDLEEPLTKVEEERLSAASRDFLAKRQAGIFNFSKPRIRARAAVQRTV